MYAYNDRLVGYGKIICICCVSLELYKINHFTVSLYITVEIAEKLYST